MASYLERYQQGEYEQVWKELVALGDGIRAEPLYGDARAVAQETMRRARHNVILLYSQLRKIGFRFLYPKEVFVPASKDQLGELDALERELGPVPLSVRAWAEEVGTVNFMGSYPRLSYYHDSGLSSAKFAIGSGPGETEILDMDGMLKKIASTDDTGDAYGPLVDLMKGMAGLLGGLSAFDAGDDDPSQPPAEEISEADIVESDPLVVDLYNLSHASYLEWQLVEDDPFVATICPDIFHKSGLSGGGGYEFALPDASADAILRNTEWKQMTFVEYLRLSFQWAGFPGLQDYGNRDESLLASLKEGLLPL